MNFLKMYMTKIEVCSDATTATARFNSLPLPYAGMRPSACVSLQVTAEIPRTSLS